MMWSFGLDDGDVGDECGPKDSIPATDSPPCRGRGRPSGRRTLPSNGRRAAPAWAHSGLSGRPVRGRPLRVVRAPKSWHSKARPPLAVGPSCVRLSSPSSTRGTLGQGDKRAQRQEVFPRIPRSIDRCTFIRCRDSWGLPRHPNPDRTISNDEAFFDIPGLGLRGRVWWW